MAGAYPLRNEIATFTRPANVAAYASGQLVANNTVAGSVVPMTFNVSRSKDGSFFLRRAKVKKSTNTTTNASFRVHLYETLPTVTNGDGGAWLSSEAGYLGFVDVTIDKAFSDPAASGHGIPVYNAGPAQIQLHLKNTNTIFGLLEARGAYTPGNAEVFTVTIEIEPMT